jgi:NlpC/P60 family
MIINTHSRYCHRVRLLLVLCAVIPASAQSNSEDAGRNHRTVRESSEAIAPWLVKPDEGLTIIGAALESRHTDPNADCSNLVHEIYERAGFTYSYANSSELYAGIKQFRRVLHPQPGDLVVWRGHVGIVISPVQHSFFSAMRSGRGVEFYNSPYWQARGRPRFYRYLKGNRTTLSASTRNTNLGRANSTSAELEDPDLADEDAAPAAHDSGATKPASSSRSLAVPQGSTMIPRATLSGTDGAQPDSIAKSQSQPQQKPSAPVATKPSYYVPRPPPGFGAVKAGAATGRQRSSMSTSGSAVSPLLWAVPHPPAGQVRRASQSSSYSSGGSNLQPPASNVDSGPPRQGGPGQ